MELVLWIGIIFTLFMGITFVTAIVGWLIEPFMYGDKWTWRRPL